MTLAASSIALRALVAAGSVLFSLWSDITFGIFEEVRRLEA